MVITAFRLIVIEILMKPKISSMPDCGKGKYECEPRYQIGENNEGEYILNIEIYVKRTKGTKQMEMTTRTSYNLTLAAREFKPTTEQDFHLFTIFTITAIDHARVFYKYELKGTIFENDLLKAESYDKHMRMMKLALGISSN